MLKLMPLFVLLVLVIGCKKDETPAPPPKKVQQVAEPAPEPPKKPEPEPEPDPPKAEAPRDVGVPECDNYLSKYRACLKEKVPAGTRAAMEKQLQITHEEWLKAVKQPGGKRQLTRACKTAFDAMATSMKAFGCEW